MSGTADHFVDLHAHYLFALDDGAGDIAMATDMVKVVTALGFSDLYATPHQRFGMFLPTRQTIDSAFRTLVETLRGNEAPGLDSVSRTSGTKFFYGELSNRTFPATTMARRFSSRSRPN